MRARLYRYAGVGLLVAAGAVGAQVSTPIPNGAMLLVAILAIAGIVLLDRSGAIR